MKKQTEPVLDETLIEVLSSRARPVQPDEATTRRMREQLFQKVHAQADHGVPDFLFVLAGEGTWATLVQGVECKLLRQDAASRSFLLRMAPGARVPPHEHALEEECIMLEGDATIHGVRCVAGDYHVAPAGSGHDWLTTEGGCLLFVRGAAPSTGAAVSVAR